MQNSQEETIWKKFLDVGDFPDFILYIWGIKQIAITYVTQQMHQAWPTNIQGELSLFRHSRVTQPQFSSDWQVEPFLSEKDIILSNRILNVKQFDGEVITAMHVSKIFK